MENCVQKQQRERRKQSWIERDVELLTLQGLLGLTDGLRGLRLSQGGWAFVPSTPTKKGVITLGFGESLCRVKVNAQGRSQLRAINHWHSHLLGVIPSTKVARIYYHVWSRELVGAAPFIAGSTKAQPGVLWSSRGVGLGRGEAREGGDGCMIVTDQHCIAETKHCKAIFLQWENKL